MDRLLLAVSTFCFLVGFAYTMHALGARVYRASRLNLFAILSGVICQTAFLYLRGQQQSVHAEKGRKVSARHGFGKCRARARRRGFICKNARGFPLSRARRR